MKNDLTLEVKEEELAVIEAQESKLRSLNDKIDSRGMELEIMVQEMMIQQ